MQRVRGLDGLRAIAVVAVLLYHADVGSVPGGFLGVDIFFVLSGYLITSLLLREWKDTGGLSFGRFYLARGRRLLPGLIGLLVGTAAAVLIFAPDAVTALRKALIPSAFYFSNWSAIYSHTSYFEQTGRPPLLLHLWSLAVEEQYYLIWPVVVLLILRKFRGQDGVRVVRKLAIWGALLSTGWMAYLSVRHGFPVPNDPSRVYYGSDTHAGGLLLGSALACAWPLGALPKLVRYERTIFDVTGLAALGGLIWACHVTSEYSTWLYRGEFLLFSFMAVIVVAVIAHPETMLGRALSVQPLRWIGERSYGLYLWHWPVFQLTRPNLDIGLTGTPNLLLRLVITGVLAELSWRFIEMPVRHGALQRLGAAVRASMQSRAEPKQRTLVGTSVSLGLAAVLVVSVLALDRPTAPASVTGIDTAPPPPPTVSASPTVPGQTVLTGSHARHQVGVDPLAKKSAGRVAPLPSSRPTTSQKPVTPATTVGSSTAWGDSVLLGASWALKEAIPGVVVNAVVGRQAGALPYGVAELRRAGLLGQTVIIHVGDNGLFLRSSLDDALNALADRKRVVIVTIAVPRRWEDPTNDLLRSIAAAHPKNVVIADWHKAAQGHPEYFVSDGVHLTIPGARAFAATIAAVAK
jgi:peptidoglycan/LPS O-acetylase OafA/YrhL